MSQVIAVSKEGIDVSGTAGTVPNNLNYSSAYNTLKYYTSGSVQLSATAAFGDTTERYGSVIHDLGYVPFFNVMINDIGAPTRFYQNSYFDVGSGAVTKNSTVFGGTDTLDFYFMLQNFSGGTLSGTVTFYYKIFRNNLGL